MSSTNPVSSTNLAFSVNPVSFTNPVSSTNSTSSTNLMSSTNPVFFTSSDTLYLRKLYVLEHYNKEINNLDNHVKLNSSYSVSQHYHRRNWLSLFYLLIDVTITNAYILYKLDSKEDKKLSHIQFQEEITQSLLRESGIILRQRLPRPP